MSNKGWTNSRRVEERLKDEDGCKQCNVSWNTRGELRPNESEEGEEDHGRDSVGAGTQRIYRDIAIESSEGEGTEGAKSGSLPLQEGT
jgi:hypothetical protein